MRPQSLFALGAVLALLAPAAAPAATVYRLQPIVSLFAPASLFPADTRFSVGTLNDTGQLVFIAGSPGPTRSETLFQYDGGTLTPIAEAGRSAPGGTWPAELRFDAPVSMNQQADVVFSAPVRLGDRDLSGTFLWSAATRSVATVALAGMPAFNDLVFTAGGGAASAISNRGEIALVAAVPDAAKQSRTGVFFRAATGELTPIALPDGELPGGDKVESASFASINDAGVVAFLARRVGDTADSAYLWSQGVITPVALVDSIVHGGMLLARVNHAWVNNKSSHVLLSMRLDDVEKGPDAIEILYRGKYSNPVCPDQEMPGGGKLAAIETVSAPNESGRTAFIARLVDGSQAVYTMGTIGDIVPVLKSGATLQQGTITQLGAAAGTDGVSLNGKGEVALGVRIHGGAPTLALLTPVKP